MYGCNKLYCEKLGTYYSRYCGQHHLDPIPPVMLDFRALLFTGLISAITLPSGGTSDYGPEMLHAAAQGRPYACFVREDTKISFMAMPDAIKSLMMLMDMPRDRLSQVVYNVAAFALTAGEFRDRAVKAFPGAQISFEPNPRRQGIVDSWPEDVDDSRRGATGTGILTMTRMHSSINTSPKIRARYDLITTLPGLTCVSTHRRAAIT
jgi:nucleoside-diphosphate-sugar epimerase